VGEDGGANRTRSTSPRTPTAESTSGASHKVTWGLVPQTAQGRVVRRRRGSRRPRTRLLDDGGFLCSISTMYRLLSIAGESRERRRQRTHPARKTRADRAAPEPGVVLGHHQAPRHRARGVRIGWTFMRGRWSGHVRVGRETGEVFERYEEPNRINAATPLDPPNPGEASD
jgi:hypothetical protein